MSEQSEETWVLRRRSGELLAADKAHSTYSPRLAWSSPDGSTAHRLAREKNAELDQQFGQHYTALHGWLLEAFPASSTPSAVPVDSLLTLFVAGLRPDGTGNPQTVLALRKHALAWLAARDEAEAGTAVIHQPGKAA